MNISTESLLAIINAIMGLFKKIIGLMGGEFDL